MLWFKRLSPAAILPRRANPTDAGLDLCAIAPARIPPGGRAVIPTGWAVQIPQGWYGRVAPRSGLAVKHGVTVFAGVIDQGYTGEIGVVLHNAGDVVFMVQPGERIAQLIIEACALLEPMECATLPDEETKRGAGGFGSSGMREIA